MGHPNSVSQFQVDVWEWHCFIACHGQEKTKGWATPLASPGRDGTP
jgi:hypothetical protein